MFPSLYEGFSHALLEAMAARLPIVTTSVGIAGDALSNEESCLMVAKHDGPALVAAVNRLIADEPLRATLGATAQALARTYRELDRVDESADLILGAADRR